MKEIYEPLQLNIFTLCATEPICASSEHDNGNEDFGDLPAPPVRHRDDE